MRRLIDSDSERGRAFVRICGLFDVFMRHGQHISVGIPEE